MLFKGNDKQNPINNISKFKSPITHQHQKEIEQTLKIIFSCKSTKTKLEI